MTDLNTWQRLAGQQRLIDVAWIDGRAHAAQDGATFAVINPATNALLARVTACSDADIDKAVRVARHSFDSGPGPGCCPGNARRFCCDSAN